MSPTAWPQVAARLTAALKPLAPPIAIRFVGDERSTPALERPYPPANAAGRTGAAPAGCVFWMLGAEGAFSTVAADHRNCSVGSYTHGLISAETAASMDDVAAVLDAGWVDMAAFERLPTLSSAPERIDYGPLADAAQADVILLRINGLALMTLKDTFDDLIIAGKPQCHIIPLAFNEQRPAASTGCALSRARTGMRAEEMTCALPGRGIDDLLVRLESTLALNRAMARYASEDAKRWA